MGVSARKSTWIVIGFAACLPASAAADVAFLFRNTTSNGGAGFASGQSSAFSLNVSDAGVSGEGRRLADFTFRVDAGALPSSICRTALTGASAGLAGISGSDGVSFQAGLPLPSGSRSGLLSASSATPELGVDHGNEWLTVRIELRAGWTFDDLVHSIGTGAMNVAIEARQAGAISNSYVAMPILTPLPSGVVAGASLSALLLLWRSRRALR